ncbi:UNVERIFIED_CONTAM: hypothetical protein Sangu_1267900 [Sesamum angustifolium]|uniref:Uncharacterized protein n=1 Tax=Sesamum angustifolium TaxID=2727405 RepID=A0AAW2NK07_9LAMI
MSNQVLKFILHPDSISEKDRISTYGTPKHPNLRWVVEVIKLIAQKVLVQRERLNGFLRALWLFPQGCHHHHHLHIPAA